MRSKFLIFNLQFLIFFFLITAPVYAADCATSHEIAVDKLNSGLLPEEVKKANQQGITENTGPFSILTNFALSFLNRIFGDRFADFTPDCITSLSPKAATQHQTEVPTELIPKDSETEDIKIEEVTIFSVPIGLLKRTAKSLGHKEGGGIYKKDLPTEIQKGAEKSLDFEKLYEQSHFPEGINPITKP